MKPLTILNKALIFSFFIFMATSSQGQPSCPGNANLLLNQGQVNSDIICLDTFQHTFGGGYVELWGNVFSPFPDTVLHQTWVRQTSPAMPDDTLAATSSGGWHIAGDSIYAPNTYVYTLVADSGCVYRDTLTIIPHCAVDDTFSTCEDSMRMINPLMNDGLANSNYVINVNYHNPQHGSISFQTPQPPQQIFYEPDSGFTGNDHFTYDLSIVTSSGLDTLTTSAQISMNVQQCCQVMVAIANADTTICPGAPIQLTGTNSSGLQLGWYSADSSQVYPSHMHSVTANPTQTTTYVYAAEGNNGCVVRDSVTISVSSGACCPGNTHLLLNQAQVNSDTICLDTFQQSFGGGYVELWGDVHVNNGSPVSVFDQSWVNITTNDTLPPSSTSGWYVAPDTVQLTSTYVYTLLANNGCVYRDTLTIHRNCNTQPQAHNDHATVCADSGIVIDVRANDTYDSTYYTVIVDSSQHGSVFIDFSGVIIYVPDSGFTGADDFYYGISPNPGGGAVDTAKVSVNVQQCGSNNCNNFTADLLINQHQVNHPVICLDTFPGTNSVQLWGGTPPNYPDSLISHQSWVRVDTLGGSVDTLHGTFPGSNWYIANAQVNHETHFIYTAISSTGCVFRDTLTLYTGCQNTPQATDDNVVTCAGQPILIDVRDNDTYGPQHGTTVNGMTPPFYGSVTVLNHNKILFEPDTGYVGMDDFWYGITDPSNPSQIIDSAHVLVQIQSCANDSVWPGDANDNGIANLYDVLNIGMAHGASAFPRPNASTSWTPQPCPNWNASFNSGVNYKHADCDGNGVIDSFDVDVVNQNYNLTHNKTSGSSGSPSSPTLQVLMDQDTVNADEQVHGSILLGDSLTTVQDVYGIAFTMNYNPALVAPNSLNLDFSTNWMATPSSSIEFIYPLPANGSVDAAYSRINQVNVSGGGQIGRVNYYIQDNIIGKQQTVILQLSISNVKLIRKDGSEVLVNVESDSVVVSSTGTGISEQQNDRRLRLYPNPATDQVMIQADLEGQEKDVMIHNTLGQEVYRKENLRSKTLRISTAGFNTGVYLVTVKSKGESRTQRMVISK